MKSIIHLGHFGLESSKKRARQALFWPLINSEIEDMIKNCPTCLAFRNQQRSEPAIKHPARQEPLDQTCWRLILIVWTLLFIGSRL